MTTLPIEDARTLGFDLLRQLSKHIGDEAAVEAELQRWLTTIGCTALAQVLLAAVRHTFTDCLSIPEEFPPGGIRFDTKETQ